MDPTAIRRTLWLTGLGHGLSHAWELIFPAVAIPMGKEFGLSYAEVIPLSFLSYLLYGLGAVPAGWATDRFGGRPVLITGLIGGGVFGIVVALSDDPTMIALALGGLGIAGSLYHPAGLAVLANEFPKKLGRAFAVNGIAGNVGIALTPVVAGLMTSLWGWRSAYAGLCVPGLLVGLWFLTRPSSAPSRRDVRPDPPKPPAHATAGSRSWVLPLVYLGLAVIFGGLAYRLYTLTLPALIQAKVPALSVLATVAPPWIHDADNLAATALTTVAFAMGSFGQWWGGHVADRRPLAPAYLLFHLAAFPLAAAASLLGGFALALPVLGYVFFAQGMQPLENRLVASLVPSSWRGRTYAGKFLLSFAFGSTGVWVAAALSETHGVASVLMCVAGLELLIVACAYAVWRRHPGSDAVHG